ncbi:LacI family DNA-binding transcriptional regulator [Pseudonocardia kunmingensis]|uniref:LacI family transcriptional regulator n=1 Tax=Pseudonocardia kunmingensis TaxID=630975 RepID=A0A543DVP8_9PSEU|nr:LacI family DNA-binding transcriptional regulator [Pseudonocardia kunmingensis]TQM13395.1 LacI family transcriptional regulator [Pseudonocardia kunmingensis]
MDPQGVSARGRAATLADVARLAGVSVGTASKALNGRGQLRSETRSAVVAAAEKLGFTMNGVARALHSGRTYTVGLVATDDVGRFYFPVLLGAEDALGPGRIAVFLCDTRGDPVRERLYVDTLVGRRVDGLIVTGCVTDPRPPIDVPEGVPVVYAIAPSADPRDASVTIDNERAGRLAVEHLLGAGRRRIGCISGRDDQRSATQRAESAARVLAEAGLALTGGAPRYGAWSEEWGRQAAHQLLTVAPDLDAVICGSDQVARGVVDALERAGRSVPGDVAVIGFDNWDVMATGRSPALTTLDPQLELIGRRAAQRLLEAIDGRPSGGVETVAPSMVFRGSTGVPVAGP